jgi:sec-independent protein translocase protein TatA
MGLDNPLHIAFLVVILLLLFGARRLPEIGRSLGTGMREFKESITGAGEKPTLTASAEQPASEPVSTTPPPAASQPPPAEVPAPAPAPAPTPAEPQRQS